LKKTDDLLSFIQCLVFFLNSRTKH